jgi:hypothetical protein
MHRFALVTPDGDVLGTVEVARPDWPAGSVIFRGGGRTSTSSGTWTPTTRRSSTSSSSSPPRVVGTALRKNRRGRLFLRLTRPRRSCKLGRQ